MKKECYIFSKPLQYFNIRNTDYRKRDTHKTLIVLGYFIDAKTFAEKIREHDDTWDKVVFLKNKYQEYLYLFFHRFENLFVEYDSTFVMGLLHKLGVYKRMYIFEEGYGSYRRDRIENPKGLKKWINKWTGVGSHVGFSRFLDGQYLYLPELYKAQFPGYDKEIRTFEKLFNERVREELPLFQHLSGCYEDFLSLSHQKITIYLTTHDFNREILETIIKESNQDELLYVKPHPHQRDLSLLEQYNLNVIRSNIMVEFLLVLLLENGNKLTVYHENSTAVIWFQHQIKDINMGKELKDYDIVASYVKEHKL
ncbi:hypothetical protein [Parabacteroides sp. PF5-9]|uniref:hypothetical protein n=1 Tax=Parabacteroides sp. PF5-9 TaxID=1742404 RepID=UPI002473B7F8|nr:hypothetical protein [Parabacteroides sp. PF5-9]MDH6358238.1 hypothetical protein [Parabacteroides sp. PF5-9]